MNINSWRYCLRQSRVSLARNFWLAVVAAGIIAISLATLGGFLLVVVNFGEFRSSMDSSVEIAVFLTDDADVEAVRSALLSLEGVRDCVFVSKEDGLKEFSRAMGDMIVLTGLDGENNPLPDLFRVRAVQAAQVPTLAARAGSIPGVELADYGEELISRLLKITGWLNALFLGISVLLAMGSIFLIVTAIRLSVLARQEEIGIMKYLGASNWFVRFPFLLEGMAIGWTGTLAAVAALGGAYYWLAVSLLQDSLGFFMQPVTDAGRLFPLFAGLIVAGTIMGALGSFLSVRKYLKV